MTLKQKAASGVLWSTADKFAVQAGQLIIGIVLARILMPEDFGLIGMLSIFIAISQSFIDSGMGIGLVQKKQSTEVDFSTVFVFNFLVSVGFYFLLFFAAPYISRFYNEPALVGLTRVLTINLIINSLTIVHRSKLTVSIDFKTIAKVNVASVIVGGLAGVFFAYQGLGVWALVIKTLISSVVSVIMFYAIGQWKPSIVFSKESFSKLFAFGSKLLLAGLYSQTINNIYNIAIGRSYSAADLGYFTRARQFADISEGTVSSIIRQVSFPILTSLQDDLNRLMSVYSRLIRMTSFITFPVLALFALLAHPIIILLLTEKWLPVVVLLQWLSLSRIFYPISSVMKSIIVATGKSNWYMKLEIAKSPVYVLALLITIPMGIKEMVIGNVVASFIAFIINAMVISKLYGYTIFNQIKDTYRIVIATVVMVLIVYVLTSMTNQHIFKLIIGVISGISSYLMVSYILRINELREAQELVVKMINRN